MKPLTFSVVWIDRLDGLRFWIDAWLGVTIHSALAAAVNAAGIGQVLIVTLLVSGSIFASFCHVFTPAAQTYPDPMPSVLAPFCAPDPWSVVEPRLKTIGEPTGSPAAVSGKILACVFVDVRTQILL